MFQQYYQLFPHNKLRLPTISCSWHNKATHLNFEELKYKQTSMGHTASKYMRGRLSKILRLVANAPWNVLNNDKRL